MNACGGCQTRTAPSKSPVPLFQIRRGYRAQWNDLAFSVETESGDWTLRVQNTAKRETLYTAHRGQARAAQIAAAEYAIFRALGPASTMTPERLATQLSWQEYW